MNPASHPWRVVAPPGTPRAEWLQARRAGLGGSDVAELVCGDPGRVYASKVHGHEWHAGPAAQRGQVLEPFVAERYAATTGSALFELGTVQRVDRPWELASPDRIAYLGPSPASGCVLPLSRWRHGVELKAPLSRTYEAWRGAEPPERYLYQVAWYAHVLGLPTWDLVALIDADVVVYRLTPQPELRAALADLAAVFWAECVLAGVAPEGASPATRRKLAELQDGAVRTPGLLEATPAAEELAAEVRELRAARALLEAKEADAVAGLCEATGDAEGLAGSSWRFTHKPTHGRVDWRAAFMAARLEAAKAGVQLETDPNDYRGDRYRAPRLTWRHDT